MVGLKVKLSGLTTTSAGGEGSRPLVAVALGTALVLVTYVSPIATVTATTIDLGAGAGARAWILSSMSVGLASLLLAAGVLGDALGRRRVYLGGLAAMALGAVGCAVATEPLLFIAGRVVEGAGGGAVLACGLAVLAHRYPAPADRVRATSVWGASVGLGIATGALLAALLADVFAGRETWRSSYWLVAGLAVGLMLLGLRTMAESAAPARARLDLAGLALLVTTMALAVAALTQARNGVGVSTVLLAFLAVIALVAFVVVERREAEPLLDPPFSVTRGSAPRPAAHWSWEPG